MFRPLAKLVNSICSIQCLQSIALKALLDNWTATLITSHFSGVLQSSALGPVRKPYRYPSINHRELRELMGYSENGILAYFGCVPQRRGFLILLPSFTIFYPTVLTAQVMCT